MNIGLLLGGDSAERDISLSSGKAIKKALISLGHEVVILDPINGISKIKDSILSVDLVFNGLHGGDGENGNNESITTLDDRVFNEDIGTNISFPPFKGVFLLIPWLKRLCVFKEH